MKKKIRNIKQNNGQKKVTIICRILVNNRTSGYQLKK